ncbi:MAG: hypothetical protein RBT65_19240 [Methanolobus sp.]|nr:hypothetical protein [Methanolobus sp.]
MSKSIDTIVKECIEYIEKNKVKEYWEDKVTMLKNGMIKDFCRYIFETFSTGCLVEYAFEMISTLDWSDEDE